jgi:hypothetical protein
MQVKAAEPSLEKNVAARNEIGQHAKRAKVLESWRGGSLQPFVQRNVPRANSDIWSTGRGEPDCLDRYTLVDHAHAIPGGEQPKGSRDATDAW